MPPTRLVAPLLLLLAASAAARAQSTDTVRLAAAPRVELLTIVHRPAGEGPHPVVLVRTPYRTRGGSTAWLAERLVPRGYVVVEQDVRGTGGSTGTFVPFQFEAPDGRTTLDWIARQPWAGPVALFGISYGGYAAFALAETGHPAVRALAVGSAWADLAPFFFPGGAFHLGAHVPWIMGFMGGGRVPAQPEFERVARTLPESRLLGPAQGVTALAERPYRWDAVRVPALHFTGWHDYLYRDVLRAHAALRAAGAAAPPQRLVVGAWAHNGEKSGATRVGDLDYGPTAAAGLDSVEAWVGRFLDEHLRGRPGADAPVRAFVLGENRWRDFAAWPPPGAASATWFLAGDGRLAPSPARRAATSAFRYDPADPMPTLGGVNSHLFPQNLGPLDQRPLAARTDLASFVGPALARPLVFAGPMRAVLWVEADAPSTDVAVKLVAVAPDGSARLVEDGIRRIPRVAPGVQEVTVDLGQRALRLDAGTRLRIDVTGGNFPKYDRNPNTGEDPMAATTLRPVRITLHHGRARPSRLEMTRLPE